LPSGHIEDDESTVDEMMGEESQGHQDEEEEGEEEGEPQEGTPHTQVDNPLASGYFDVKSSSTILSGKLNTPPPPHQHITGRDLQKDEIC
jgi:hypothetical protein